mmetsp:Transcript_2948/g.6296  ORF Transcript_2948/g.6296 Transcript_2948/m.6296 type:complete len:397 (-) Transcript_2948:91-1281(-)
MIRFFVMGIWDVVAELGYSHIMRLDEDSFLWSPITYNIFEFMRDRQLDYAYRLGGWERAFETRFAGPVDLFHSLIRKYALERRLGMGWLLGSCLGACSVANFSVHHCGNTYVIYNNFFVTRVGFWRQPDVQDFLRYVNSTESIYYERVGDALWHSGAAALFMSDSRLHMFHDWAYEHATFRTVRGPSIMNRTHVPNETGRVCLHYGGMVLPRDAPAQEHTLQPAQSRMAALLRVAAEGHCDDGGRSLKDRACVHREREGHIAGVWQGTGVSVEQTRCDQDPQPFHCTLSNADLPSNFDKLDRMYALQDMQKRHVCSNWCPTRPPRLNLTQIPAGQHRMLVAQHRELERNSVQCSARGWQLWMDLYRPPRENRGTNETRDRSASGRQHLPGTTQRKQ